MSKPSESNGRDERAILAMVASGELSTDQALEMLHRVDRGLYCKVSRRGAVSLYGLQRLPVTLYADQWRRLLDFGDEMRKFLAEHDKEVARKPGELPAPTN